MPDKTTPTELQGFDHLHKLDKKKIIMLMRRRDYLAKRIDHGQGNNYVKAEHSAISWAINVIQETQKHYSMRDWRQDDEN